MVDRCCNDKSIPDEVLYGKAGYLYALLFVQKYIGEGTVNERTILKVMYCYPSEVFKLCNEVTRHTEIMITVFLSFSLICVAISNSRYVMQF